MATPSTFYKFIGDSGYERLVKEGVIREMKFSTLYFGGDLLKYKMMCDHMNDQAYGKFIEQKLCEYLGGTLRRRDLKMYIPDLSTSRFYDALGKPMRVVTGSDPKFDLLYNKYLIDIKTYKKPFTDSNLRSFYLQLVVYYSLIGDKGIKYIAIFNPVSGEFLYMDVKGIDVGNVLRVYNGCSNIVDTLIDNGIVKLKKRISLVKIIKSIFKFLRK